MKCKHCGEEIQFLEFEAKWRHVHAVTSSGTLYRDRCLADTVAEPVEEEKPETFEVDRIRLESSVKIAMCSSASNRHLILAHSVADEIERAVEYVLAKRGLGLRQIAKKHGIDLDKVRGTDPDTICPPAMSEDIELCKTCKYRLDALVDCRDCKREDYAWYERNTNSD